MANIETLKLNMDLFFKSIDLVKHSVRFFGSNSVGIIIIWDNKGLFTRAAVSSLFLNKVILTTGSVMLVTVGDTSLAKAFPTQNHNCYSFKELVALVRRYIEQKRDSK